jgi:hypothetical protein
VIKSPVTAWPIPWATIAADLASAGSPAALDPGVLAARARVIQRLDTVRGLTGLQPNAKISVRTDPFWLRNFEDTPREESEVRAGVSWMGDRFAARAQVSFVADPLPGDNDWRGDGSYVAAVLGNHIFHAGALDRWWGPSHDDTLILSNNARPVPGLGVERNVAMPFEHRWLAWLGPWTYSFYWGFLESHRDYPNARLTAFRFGFRPLNDLEIGLTRTAQWCGQGRPCDGSAFWDVVVGDSNVDDRSVAIDEDQDNQLAAIDFRWQSPFTNGPWAIYGQATAEDEAGGFPSRYFGQVGGETWGTMNTRWFSGQWRAHLEYTNTLIHFWQSDPYYKLAYEHGIYTDGLSLPRARARRRRRPRQPAVLRRADAQRRGRAHVERAVTLRRDQQPGRWDGTRPQPLRVAGGAEAVRRAAEPSPAAALRFPEPRHRQCWCWRPVRG